MRTLNYYSYHAHDFNLTFSDFINRLPQSVKNEIEVEKKKKIINACIWLKRFQKTC